MDLSTYLTPWTIGGGVAGLVLSVATLMSLIMNRRHVGVVVKKAAASLFSQIGFFSVVIIVFMVISVLESGQFFNEIKTIDHLNPLHTLILSSWIYLRRGQNRHVSSRDSLKGGC